MFRFNFSNPKVPSSYIQTPHHNEQLLCPWGKKALALSPNSTRLIRTLFMAPSVSVLTRFDFISLRPTIEFNLDMLNRLKTFPLLHYFLPINKLEKKTEAICLVPFLPNKNKQTNIEDIV